MPNAQIQALNIPDVVLGLVLVIGLFLGLFVGLFRQAIVFASTYVSVLVASRFYVDLGSGVPLSISPNGTVRSAIAFGVIFVVLVIVLSVLTHYIPNPMRHTSQPVFLSGRAGAAVVGFLWASLMVAVTVTVLTLAVGGSWGIEREQTQLKVKAALRQSNVVQVLNNSIWPISKGTSFWLPLGPFLPS